MLKWTRRAALWGLLAMIAAGLAVAWLLRGSLARLDGQAKLPGLGAAVTVQRDELGVVTIDAASATDAMRALGFVHAQERYFEMDLMRRSAAGELAELVGPAALELDRRHRVHRLRARVMEHLDRFGDGHERELWAYADGANAGLDALHVRPWPYLLLRQKPRRWSVADSALTGYAMYFDLQDAGNRRELAMWRIGNHLPPALAALLAHDGSRWDAPMSGAARGDAVLPDADEVDLRRLPSLPGTSESPAAMVPARKGTPGSNNWAVAGALTADGRAIVADDMHLGLRAPALWFRVRLRYPDPRAPGGRVDVSGVSLPGLPAIVVGSNGHVAWGFTNSYADTADWYPLRPCAGGTQAAPPGCERTWKRTERLRVAGAAPVDLVVEESRYGPVLHPARGDRPALALRWVAHQPGALNVRLADLAVAGDLDAALQLADSVAIPAQNLVIGDRMGAIGWRILGPLPDRGGARGDACGAPLALAPGRCAPWPITTRGAPSLVHPPAHRLWTANARVVDGQALARVGDGGYALGARARQIRDGLFASERFTEADMLAIQLDDRALFLHRWWQLLQDEAQQAGAGSALQALARAGGTWEGRAAVDSVSYRMAHDWRLAVHARIVEGLLAPAQAALGEDFMLPDLPQMEGVVWPLLEQRPPHLLSPRYPDWPSLLEAAAGDVRDALAASGPLEERTWGEHNTAHICHPLAGALPGALASMLCMPAQPLPGDGAMPRVQQPAFGASERMVVAPGHEADGILHMPGGQSGHPLSPFWGAGHDDWVRGRPTPFLPGPARHTLVLRPR